jgi:hypothetical protein
MRALQDRFDGRRVAADLTALRNAIASIAAKLNLMSGATADYRPLNVVAG